MSVHSASSVTITEAESSALAEGPSRRKQDEAALRQPLRRIFSLYREQAVEDGHVAFKRGQFLLRFYVPSALLLGGFAYVYYEPLLKLFHKNWVLGLLWFALAIVTYILMIPVTSVEEAGIHTTGMHRRCRFRVIRWFLDPSHKAHDLEHHGRTPPSTLSGKTKSYSIRFLYQVMHSTFPGYILGIFWPMNAVPTWLLFSYALGLGIWAAAILAGVLGSVGYRYKRYEETHVGQHLPDPMRIARFLDARNGPDNIHEDNHHRLHHYRTDCNLNVVKIRCLGRWGFIGDILLGTYVETGREYLSDEEIQALVQTRPRDYINPGAPLGFVMRFLHWLFLPEDHEMFRAKTTA